MCWEDAQQTTPPVLIAWPSKTGTTDVSFQSALAVRRNN